jgi:prevent-host-death family protein
MQRSAGIGASCEGCARRTPAKLFQRIDLANSNADLVFANDALNRHVVESMLVGVATCGHRLIGIMKERSIEIRALKAKLSECVREVKKGATIVVTDHGRRVARIVPESYSLDERLDTLKNSATILWSGRRLPTGKPAVHVRAKRSVADIVVENRE